MKIKEILLLAFTLFIAPTAVIAAPISIGDFDAPTIQEFESFSGASTINDGLVLDGATFTEENGTLRTFSNTSSFANCFGGCLTTDFGDFLDVTFDTVFNRVGAFVGSSVAPLTATVSFFDALDNLLGDIVISGLPAGDSFVGFESLVGIKRVRFLDTDDDSFVLSIDRLHTENLSAVPVPAALPLFGTGIAVMGFIGWRRKRKLA